jgi:hypothetical protein
MLLASLLEHIDRKPLLLLQQKLVESDLSDAGWDFELTEDGLTASNPEMPGHVALGPLHYGSCRGATNEDRVADLVSYFNDDDIPTVTAIIHQFDTDPPSMENDWSNSTVIFPSSTAAFEGAIRYEGMNDPLDMLQSRFNDFVSTLMTAKHA